MTYEKYFEVLTKANQDSPRAFLQALGVLVQMEKQRKEYEEDMNQLEKQRQEEWWHRQDQENSNAS